MIKRVWIFLLIGLFLATTFSGAYGVSLPYTSKRPLKIVAGDERTFNLTMQNGLGGRDYTFYAEVIGEQDIASLVEGIIVKKDTEKARTSNVKSVTGKFKELYGDKAEEEYYNAAADKGLSRDEINRLAASNPSAVFKILGIDQIKPNTGSLNTSVNSDNFKQEPPKPEKFNPFNPSVNPAMDAWRKSTQATNERLGIE